jgi:hypothetical protein
MTTFAEAKLIPAMEPWLTPSLEVFLRAAGVMFDPISEVLEGGDEGTPIWGKILDPNQFPAKYNPSYLAQFAGVAVPPGTSFADAIQLIVEDVARRRGTPGLILAEAQRALAEGAQSARLIERENANGQEDAYYFLIGCRAQDVQGSLVTAGNVKAAEAKIKSLPSTVGVEVGDLVVALGLPSGTTVTVVGSGEVTVSAESTVTAVGTKVVFVSPAGLQLVRNYVDGVKPGGVLWALVTGATYLELEETFSSYKAVEEAFTDYAHLELEA